MSIWVRGWTYTIVLWGWHRFFKMLKIFVAHPKISDKFQIMKILMLFTMKPTLLNIYMLFIIHIGITFILIHFLKRTWYTKDFVVVHETNIFAFQLMSPRTFYEGVFKECSFITTGGGNQKNFILLGPLIINFTWPNFDQTILFRHETLYEYVLCVILRLLIVTCFIR